MRELPPVAGVPGAYWVNYPLLLAGGHPGGMGQEKTRGNLSDLLAAGIGCLIDLTEEGETRGGRGAYNQNTDSRSGAHKTVPEVNRFPIPDFGTPTPELMVHILDTIDSRMTTSRAVYLHCMGGRGRTGTVVGCWLARHGIARGDDALTRITQLRAAAGLPGGSPETEDQRAMVRGWDE